MKRAGFTPSEQVLNLHPPDPHRWVFGNCLVNTELNFSSPALCQRANTRASTHTHTHKKQTLLAHSDPHNGILKGVNLTRPVKGKV